MIFLNKALYLILKYSITAISTLFEYMIEK